MKNKPKQVEHTWKEIWQQFLELTLLFPSTQMALQIFRNTESDQKLFMVIRHWIKQNWVKTDKIFFCLVKILLFFFVVLISSHEIYLTSGLEKVDRGRFSKKWQPPWKSQRDNCKDGKTVPGALQLNWNGEIKSRKHI